MTLGQIQNNKEVVIAYDGRKLNKAECNYSTTEREALALVSGIKKFQPYLYGRKFKVYTDHCPLKYLINMKNPTSKLARWSILFQTFDFEVIYRQGKKHNNADSLSRRPYDVCNLSSDHTKESEIYQKQRRDPNIVEIINFLEHGELPEDDKQARKLLLLKDQFYIGSDGLLYRINHNIKKHKCRTQECYSQLVLPSSMKFEVLSNLHDHVSGGHFGVHKTFHKVNERYWWDGMFKNVEHWCNSCVDCATRKTPRNRKRAPLLPLENAFDRVAIDALGPFPVSNQGNRYILVITDYLTRWCEAFPVKSIDANVVARILVDEIISRYSCPTQLLSDRGTNFLSKVVAEVCTIFQIHKYIKLSPTNRRTSGEI